ncbi:MAG: roadblock/LC7 domain-containing protein [Wohlfahrtiimonas sp.]
MGKSYLSDLTAIEGFKAASLVDANTRLSLASYGSGIDIELASDGNAAVLNTKRRVVQLLELDDVIEDILISLGKEYHLIRPLVKQPNIFLYLVLDRKKSNLGLARHFLKTFEHSLEF